MEMNNMVYILLGDSSFDYEIRNIIFGIFTDEKMAEQKKIELENIQKENGNDEMILYVISKELNSTDDKNIKNYLQ